MDENQILTQLLGIKQLEVSNSAFVGAGEIYLTVEPLLKVAACPDCSEISLHEHDRGDAQKVRDLSVAERRCWLVYRPRRFRCEGCQKTFVERVEWRRAGMSYTTRYEHYIYQRSRREPISQVAQDEGLSEEAVQAIFEDWAKKRSRHKAARGSK
jgi:transposase